MCVCWPYLFFMPLFTNPVPAVSVKEKQKEKKNRPFQENNLCEKVTCEKGHVQKGQCYKAIKYNFLFNEHFYHLLFFLSFFFSTLLCQHFLCVTSTLCFLLLHNVSDQMWWRSALGRISYLKVYWDTRSVLFKFFFLLFTLHWILRKFFIFTLESKWIHSFHNSNNCYYYLL